MQMPLVSLSGKAQGFVVLFWNPSDYWIESYLPPPPTPPMSRHLGRSLLKLEPKTSFLV